MDQEQPTVWPPAPKGMEPTPSTNVSTFKPAPTQWVIGLTALSAFERLIDCLSNLGLGLSLKVAIFATIESALAQPWNIIYLVAGIAFFVWFYRVYKNLTAFETAGLRYTAGWAVGWFFVPIFSIFRPYQISQTIWKASAANIDNRNVNEWQRVSSGGIVIAWWTVSILADTLAFIPAFNLYGSKVASPGYHLESAIASAFAVATQIVTIFMIRAISVRQQEKEVTRFWSTPE